MLGYTKVAIYLLFVTNGTILWRVVYLLRINCPSCIAAKRAKHAIIHAIAMKYDCPIVIMPIKSRNPVNLLAFVCRNWLCLCLSRLSHPNKFGGSRCSRHSILCFTTYELVALTVFTNAISPIIIHSTAGSFSHGYNLYPTAKTNTKSAKLSNLAPNLLSTPHCLARKAAMFPRSLTFPNHQGISYEVPFFISRIRTLIPLNLPRHNRLVSGTDSKGHW